jgi:hypothetical protein
LAYFQVGLPDGAFELLQGNLMHDMYRYISPGALGSHNGGLDFNDIVNPAARTFIEGLFGLRPDVPNKVIQISPQLSPAWDNASLTTPYVNVGASGFRQGQGTASGTTAVSVELKKTMACPDCLLKVVLPLRATRLHEVSVNGEACGGASCNYSVAAGWGQSVVTVLTAAPQAGMGIEVALHYSNGVGYVRAVNIAGSSGGQVQLHVGAGAVERVDDPQRALASHSIEPNGTLSCVLSSNASGHSLVSVTVRVGSADDGGSLLQQRLFKLNVTDAASTKAHAAKTTVPEQEARASVFTPLNISMLLNGNLSEIFHPHGGYLEPRPQTCASRIATDGYSPWSFKNAAASQGTTCHDLPLALVLFAVGRCDELIFLCCVQGDMPPYPNFRAVENETVVTGVGARFELDHTSTANVAFVSQWHNYPTAVTVPLSNISTGDVVWLLISGSTNNMQTRLANAVIRFQYASSDMAEERLELIPPLNYWSLTPIAGKDYDYVRDGFCLPPNPPPTMQLGDHNRAMVYSWRPSGALASVTVEALSLEVVVGLLAVSVSRLP